ncbi:hypothetical protein F0562_017126 [Nyssa sinensis]|uniref:DUF4283 domain-containing protein n=1 Tax=Nyssa sinensis TaxID=561372 RepID=A0A5J4ZHF2_9ASTE|nr:hypothetical protein F0562_017126 [Nyssa sinensis]
MVEKGDHNRKEGLKVRELDLRMASEANEQKANTMSWTQLFKGNKVKENGVQLNFVHPENQQGQFKAQIRKMDVVNELARWENSLVGYVVGEIDKFEILDKGPWFVDSKPVILKPRTRDCDIGKNDLTHVSNWIRPT